MKYCPSCCRERTFYGNDEVCGSCRLKKVKETRPKRTIKVEGASICTREPWANLAAAVIRQAVKDALGVSPVRVWNKRLARNWFFEDDIELFASVCGLSITHVRKWAKERFRYA